MIWLKNCWVGIKQQSLTHYIFFLISVYPDKDFRSHEQAQVTRDYSVKVKDCNKKTNCLAYEKIYFVCKIQKLYFYVCCISYTVKPVLRGHFWDIKEVVF
jgi:ssDNA-specific exonuclease RecJ